MTESEFKGFCYQTDGSLKGGSDCDNIAICDTYTVVMDMPQQSLQECLQGCIAINKQNNTGYMTQGCINVSQSGMDYCQRYCRTTYGK